jgi:hypothetical protein
VQPAEAETTYQHLALAKIYQKDTKSYHYFLQPSVHGKNASLGFALHYDQRKTRKLLKFEQLLLVEMVQ